MATFVWPQEVRWPPPANILLNYDVVPPGVVSTTTEEQTRRKHMPYVSGFLKIVQRRDRWGRPVDPDYGVDVGGEDGGEEGPGEPGGGWPGRPIDPGFGNRPGGGGRPIDPGFGNPGRPGWGGDRPVDPGYGVGEGPIRPVEPEEPGKPGLPPGMIIPPLPPDLDIGFHGKAYLGVTLVYKGQRHHHHIVVNVPEQLPERPDRPDLPERPPGVTPPAGGIGGAPPPRPAPGR